MQENESPNSGQQMSALYGALAAAQGAFKPIEKNRTVEIKPRDKQAYKFRYADLEEILTKTRPALSENGLALIQRVEHHQNGPLLICCLVHAGGGMLTSEVQIQSARELSDPKAFGAAITYHRRYLVTAMLGVAADDDLDEDGQEIEHSPAPQKASSAQKARARQEPASYPQRSFEANLPSWKDLIKSGKKSPSDIIAIVSTKGVLSEDQMAAIHACATE